METERFDRVFAEPVVAGLVPPCRSTAMKLFVARAVTLNEGDTAGGFPPQEEPVRALEPGDAALAAPSIGSGSVWHSSKTRIVQ